MPTLGEQICCIYIDLVISRIKQSILQTPTVHMERTKIHEH